ncbi:hypothetical protein GGD66_008147 [Bradyrhizobium sp. CIR48]|uniref:hypothetical protein n=1 Tax=unclassified Bradyrhizobium TaxID=2631580 RepID=UPI0016057786|nr:MULTISPECIES: hypothetical protein [unclassified Bradyrhizobium]MBB4360631.1 hypothetical protein [Bradyrhizobium sp. CIR18]MBB4429543.1 hypothetical protein [Bradyrhizobium sp. CIR48]
MRPFVEYGGATSNVGYRDASTGQVVTLVEIPSEAIERAIFASVSVEIALSGDGEIASTATGTLSGCSIAKNTMSIDQLVEAFLSSDNLHMEEVTKQDLEGLLARLQKSIDAVRRSIALLQLATSQV